MKMESGKEEKIERATVRTMENTIEKSKGMLAVWALFSRSSFYGILAVLFLMTAAECLSFYAVLHGSGQTDMLEMMIDKSLAAAFFLTALGLIFFIQIWAAGRMDRKSRYTLMRLKLSKTQFFLLRTGYHVLCLTSLFAVQVCVILWMAWMYEKTFAPVSPSGQLLFLAFYRNEFLHSLLPMAETGKWVRCVLLILAFGIEAGFQEKNRVAGQVGMFVLTACWFVSPVGMWYGDVICCVTYGIVIGMDLLQAGLFQRKERDCGHSIR